MTTIPDIIGADHCACRRPVQDIADAQVWAILEAEHPGVHKRAQELLGIGARFLVTKYLERPRDRARRIDDGVMSVRALAAAVGCCYETARRARKEKSRV